MIKLTCIGAGFAGLLFGAVIASGVDYVGTLLQSDMEISQPPRSLWRMITVPYIAAMVIEKEFLQRIK